MRLGPHFNIPDLYENNAYTQQQPYITALPLSVYLYVACFQVNKLGLEI